MIQVGKGSCTIDNIGDQHVGVCAVSGVADRFQNVVQHSCRLLTPLTDIASSGVSPFKDIPKTSIRSSSQACFIIS